MANKKLSQIEKKKQELEQELAEIQNGLDRSIDDVKEGVSYNLDPKNIIRKYPLPVVGASILLGFLIGKEPKKRPRVSSRSNDDLVRPESRIVAELKRVLAKKGMSILLDILDQKIANIKEQKRPSDQ